MAEWKKLSPVMIEALIVLRVCGSVRSGDLWERGVGSVKAGTVTALVDRDLIMRSPQGEWVATRKGYFAMAVEKIITFDAAEREQADLDEDIDALHAEALGVNEKLTQIARLEAHPSTDARIAAYEIRDELLHAGFAKQAVSDVTAAPQNSIQRAEDVLKKLASKPQVAVISAPAEPASSVTVANGQRWLCVKGRDKGKLIELEYVATRAPLWWYRNLSARRVRRVVGRITEAELHARWELRNCEHEEIIDDCSKCWCPFHGVAFGQCDCRAPKVAP
jgi:hypothetical protein